MRVGLLLFFCGPVLVVLVAIGLRRFLRSCGSRPEKKGGNHSGLKDGSKFVSHRFETPDSWFARFFFGVRTHFRHAYTGLRSSGVSFRSD
jgi:hypothetical protein